MLAMDLDSLILQYPATFCCITWQALVVLLFLKLVCTFVVVTDIFIKLLRVKDPMAFNLHAVNLFFRVSTLV
jgi:hypothetical protein